MENRSPGLWLGLDTGGTFTDAVLLPYVNSAYRKTQRALANIQSGSFLSDDVLEEIAQRVGLNMIQVTETLEYYSMLRRKPAGRFHIQVCTNISCMLRGGNELFQHVQKRLEIGNKQVSPTGTFSLEEVECIGACSWAPAMQVNYDFHHKVTFEKLDQILEACGKSNAL